MVLLLHQVETLKSFVLESIKSTDKILLSKKEERIPEGTKKPMAKSWELLVRENIITEEESKDIERIIEIRNEIGHSIHGLVVDVSAPQFMLQNDKIYDYFALERFEQYQKKIEHGMRAMFILKIGFREIAFEEAEKTYKEELKRLSKKIDRQYKIRKQIN